MFKNVEKDRIEIENVNYLFERYKSRENILIGVDYLSVEDKGIDLVVYDTTNMLTEVGSFEDFIAVVDENGLDEEEFEVDRVTLVRM